MNIPAYPARYDDHPSSSPWAFSRTASMSSSGTSGSYEEEDDDDEETSGDESYSYSESTSPTNTVPSPSFHPTGLTGRRLQEGFTSMPPDSPEQPEPALKSYPMSYSSFSNYHPTPSGPTAPRLQPPRPPKAKPHSIPIPPPAPPPEPLKRATEQPQYRDAPKPRVSHAPPRPSQPEVHREAPKPRISVAVPPPAPPPPPQPDVYREAPKQRVSQAAPPPPPQMKRSKSSTISDLRDAISSIELQVAQLLAQKRELEMRLEQEVRVESPVDRLPSELLSSIFVRSVGVGQEEENNVMLATIMLVCRQWNEVALNTPILWCKIDISPHDPLVRAKRRLERSGSSPLDISINFGPRAEYTTTKTTTYTSAVPVAPQNSASGVSSASGSSTTYVSTNPFVLNSHTNTSNASTTNASNSTTATTTKTTTTTVNVIDSIIRSMELFKLVLWRTRSLTLRVPNRHQAHAALMRCRDYPAPLLEHLTIHIYHSMLDGPSYFSSSGAITTTSASASSSGESFTLYGGTGNGPAAAVAGGAQGAAKLTPLPLFAGQTPMLKTCSFTSFNFGWDVGMVRRLRVLRLGGYFNGYAPTLSALVAILRECPELEELSLRNLSEGDGDGNEMDLHGGNNSCDSPIASRLGCGGHHGGTSISALTSNSHAVSAASKTISLPKLRSLTLYYASPAHHLLPLLSLPGLQHLTLAFLQNISSTLQCLYTQALTRLPLKTMRIESCIFNEIVFINLMRRLNGLVKLEMVDCEDLSGGALRNLTSLTPNTPSPLPRVTHLTLDGCTSLDFDSLRIFVEARLPPNPHTFKRFHNNAKEIVSSASEAARLAEAAKQTKARHTSASASASASAAANTSASASGTANASAVSGTNVGGAGDMLLHPARLVSIDVTRCTQISKEMVQWLRMYVAEVKCESAKGMWGD